MSIQCETSIRFVLTLGRVEINGGLVVIVGDLFAEKSSVALHLSVLGYRLFGSEQIAISMGPDPLGLVSA